MKGYVAVTGSAFALIVVAHLLRVADEGPALARDPFFVVMTLVAAALALWALVLVIRLRAA